MVLQPVVLSGGSGTRMWPLSREKFPKQLLALTGDSTLLQATVARTEGIAGAAGITNIEVAAPVVVCNEEYRFLVAEQLRAMGKPGTVILEPVGRNTAPALTLAALAAAEADPVMLVMPADHFLQDIPAFCSTVARAAKLAADGAVVTFGICPDAPETGYGYIQVGAAYGSEGDEVFAPAPAPGGARRIARFVEKPDAATAQRYLDDGGYLWNSGIFVLRASVWLRALSACRPDIHAACTAAWEQRPVSADFVRVDAQAFTHCPGDSIDYAVMERLVDTPELAPGVVLPLAAGWSDVGAWDALWKVSPKDDDGNAVHGDVLLHGCAGSLVQSESRLVACVGVRDLVVVETADAVLVAHKDRTQEVKQIVDALRSRGRSEGLTHRKVFRPWGWYDCVDAGERFQVKRIVVQPQGVLSLQLHHHRAEHWIVVRGTARVTCADKNYLVSENQSTFIPLGVRHRLENPGRVPLEMIEVQSGSYLGEDDIVRFEDAYGR
ncbi:mannose-1-phosphate guanylyltransferase/mannose-6-phosphate isomerase [Candidatus Symbiobacter mobilis]|nr:mannose-1-phosphate guanylyltransferase/mannose-6-phosphate isomerase [Candidatus Symbiobacter mobilis]